MNPNRKNCIICDRPLNPRSKRKLERVTCSPQCARIYLRVYRKIKPYVIKDYLEGVDSLDKDLGRGHGY